MSPSPFVAEWVERLSSRLRPRETRRAALDVAMGRGRHAVVLARAGYRTFGVDVRVDAVRDAVACAAAEGLAVRGWCADLTQHPLPAERFDVIVVTRYLQRDLFPALRRALVPGGTLVYETFTVDQLALGTGPRSPDHLLRRGELPTLCNGLTPLFFEEVKRPEAVARIVAEKAGWAYLPRPRARRSTSAS